MFEQIKSQIEWVLYEAKRAGVILVDDVEPKEPSKVKAGPTLEDAVMLAERRLAAEEAGVNPSSVVPQELKKKTVRKPRNQMTRIDIGPDFYKKGEPRTYHAGPGTRMASS